MTKRGRPVACNAKQRRHVAALARKYTASGAQAILAAGTKDALAKQRSAKLFPEPVVLSLPTVCKYARENGVELKRGRRAA